MKIYLDDKRPAPEGWIRAFWPEEVINHLKTGIVEEISLDWHLGEDLWENPKGRSGIDVLSWLGKNLQFAPSKIQIHTGCKPMKAKMERMVEQIQRRSRLTS